MVSTNMHFEKNKSFGCIHDDNKPAFFIGFFAAFSVFSHHFWWRPNSYIPHPPTPLCKSMRDIYEMDDSQSIDMLDALDVGWISPWHTSQDSTESMDSTDSAKESDTDNLLPSAIRASMLKKQRRGLKAQSWHTRLGRESHPSIVVVEEGH